MIDINCIKNAIDAWKNKNIKYWHNLSPTQKEAPLNIEYRWIIKTDAIKNVHSYDECKDIIFKLLDIQEKKKNIALDNLEQ